MNGSSSPGFDEVAAPLIPLLSSQLSKADDECVSKDGAKTTHVHPARGVKQGSPLSPLFFSLYINDVDLIAEDVRGAVTGTKDVCVIHMLLYVYVRKKRLIINNVKSEVMHFNSEGSNLPICTIGNGTLAHKDSFKYLGIMFCRALSMAKSAKVHLALCLHLLTGFAVLYVSTHWQIGRKKRLRQAKGRVH
eukprot:639910-Pelagomonas_calceolata.AAC.1